MKHTLRFTQLALMLTMTTPLFTALGSPNPLSFDGAMWIWDTEAKQKAGTWYFQKGFDFPAGEKPQKAQILITCDNLWTLYVNDNMIGVNDTAPNAWNRPRLIDVSNELIIEQNSIAVEGVNTIPGPAGLLVKLEVQFESGKTYTLISDGSWISSPKPEKGWENTGFTPGDNWSPCHVIGPFGIGPWNKFSVKKGAKPAKPAKAYPKETEFKDAIFKAGVVFVGDSQNFNVSGQPTYVQFINGTRAYFEMDPMTPAAIGAKLYSLIPFTPDGRLTLLCDAEGGKIGSPSVSYDGKTIFFSMAKRDDPWFHIYAINPDGNNLRQITKGPFHDYDPAELPDGRLVFSSTRLGNREEYHAKYASSLFTCNAEGEEIVPLTFHIAADREPRVTADGSLVFLRMDTFMERAKVEVHLHQTRLDGTAGQVIVGPGRQGIQVDRDAAAEHEMKWLRRFGAGSPAPLPDGRVAAISEKGLVTSEDPTGRPVGGDFLPYDISALPDGRLLCTSLRKKSALIFDLKRKEAKEIISVKDLGIRDLHSIVHLGARRKPGVMPSMIDKKAERSGDKTGFLYCQNVLNTQHTSTDTKRIRAIRVYEGRPFTLEPTKSIYEHIGTVGVELGTVPLMDDGSFYIEVPADRPLALQAIDGEGRAVINELSWIYTRPGEQRSCVGCHAEVRATPKMTVSQALKVRPLKLTGQGSPHRFRANNGANGGIANLQMDRFREAAAINLPGNIEELLKVISAGNADNKISAIQRVSILRDRTAQDVLIKALTDSTAEVRCAAALALSTCGGRKAVQPLMSAANDKHPLVKQAVRNALEHLTGRRDGGTKWDKLEQELIEKSMPADMQEVHLAFEAMGHIGGDAAKKRLRKFITSNPEGELRVLMAAMRSLGYLQDKDAIPLLTQIMNDNLTKKGKGGHHEFGFGQKPIYLSATAAEALGRIGGEQAEAAILESFPKLNIFEDYVFRVAEHKWLMGVHSSVLHFRMLEALDRIESTKAGPLVEKIIESIPADKDRGLLYELDSYERLSARIIERSGRMKDVIESCLSVLGDKNSKPVNSLTAAVSHSPHAEKHIRKHSAQARAAQILSVLCTDRSYAPRIRSLLKAYHTAEPSETRSWCCFMLIRTLGRLNDQDSISMFISMLESDPTESELGLNPPPAHIIYKGWRPFYRPAAAWALGQLQAKEAAPVLLKTVENLDNASSTREQAALALGTIGEKSILKQLNVIAEDYPEIMTRRALLQSELQLRNYH